MISTETNRNDYTGNGTTADYDYDFKIFNREDLEVIVSIDGEETVLVLDTDYTVSDAGEDTGGNISLIDAGQDWIDGSSFLLTGVDLTIVRNVPYVQETDIRNQAEFYPETHEDTFDVQEMQIQQLKDVTDRAIVTKVTDLPSSPMELPATDDRANKFFYFDANGLPVAVSLDEYAMDAIGSALTDTASVDMVYSDAGNTISANVIPGGVNHNLLLNTHNLTTDIDHDQLTNTHNLTTDIDHDAINNTHNLTTDIDHDQLTNTHNLTTDIDHDAIAGYVADEHIPHSSVTLTAGSGLSGGGTISANRTFNVDINSESGVTPTTSDEILIADASDSFNIRKATISDIVALSPAGYTDEEAQDAVGTILADSSTIDFTYTDGTPEITAAVIPGGISHDDIADVTTQDHKRHSNLTVTRDGNGIVTQLDWANGDQEIVNRDGNNLVTSIVGNVWTKTVTRDGNDRITAIAWTLT